MQNQSCSLHCRFLLFFALALGWSQFEQSAVAQAVATNPSQAESDRIDARAYAVLFRRAVAYQKMANAATSPDKPEAQLTKVLPNRFQLSDPDAANLQRIATAWAAEMAPIRAQIVAAVAAFHKSLNKGNAGVDATPPAALGDFQKQQDAITLRYRDSLRNAMRTEDFTRVHGQVKTLFGNGQLTAYPNGTNGGVTQ